MSIPPRLRKAPERCRSQGLRPRYPRSGSPKPWARPTCRSPSPRVQEPSAAAATGTWGPRTSSLQAETRRKAGQRFSAPGVRASSGSHPGCRRQPQGPAAGAGQLSSLSCRLGRPQGTCQPPALALRVLGSQPGPPRPPGGGRGPRSRSSHSFEAPPCQVDAENRPDGVCESGRRVSSRVPPGGRVTSSKVTSD